MPKRLLKILGINLGTRYMGIAVFEGPELKDWGVKVVKGRGLKQKMDKAQILFPNLVKRYEPNVLAIKKLHPSRSSLYLNWMTDKIKRDSKRKGLKVYQYSIGDLESFFSPEEKINKKKLAELIASRYPELFNEFGEEKGNKNPYHIRMFEAVALGSICFHQLDK